MEELNTEDNQDFKEDYEDKAMEDDNTLLALAKMESELDKERKEKKILKIEKDLVEKENE